MQTGLRSFMCLVGDSIENSIENNLTRAIVRASIVVDALINQQEQKIYTLVDAVSKEGVYGWSDDALLAMYQKLFITQAAVCELYFHYDTAGGQTLWITPVSVLLCTNISSASNDDKKKKKAPLAAANGERYLPNFEFYMTYDNFFSATSHNVQKLLDQFWTRYETITSYDTALSLIGLKAPVEWYQVQRRYRELAAKYHPDKGGDANKFIEIRRAYESLKHILKI